MKFESALQASEERLRAIFSQSAAGIVQTDLRGHLLLVNNLFCEILAIAKASCYRCECGISVLPETSPRQTGSLKRWLNAVGVLRWRAAFCEKMARWSGWQARFRRCATKIAVSSKRRHHRRHYRMQARAGRRASSGRDHRVVQRCHPWHRPWHEDHELEHWHRRALWIYG